MSLETRERFEKALETIQTDLEFDDHVLAAILCGSLSYDEVWEKSDIDLVVLTSDEKQREVRGLALMAEDVNIHTQLMSRSEFKRHIDASQRNSTFHSMFARSKLIFTKDPSIEDLFEQLHHLGQHDLMVQVMQSMQLSVMTLYKAKKWLKIKKDNHYTAHWVLHVANVLAKVVLSRRGILVDREALVEACQYEPELFKLIYTDLFDGEVSHDKLTAAIEAIDAYMEPIAEEVFSPVIEYLKEAGGEPRSGTEIEHYFNRNYALEHTVTGCEWLSDIGLIEKASIPTKLTLYSQNEVEELAFFVS